jgi:hypothetical protein
LNHALGEVCIVDVVSLLVLEEVEPKGKVKRGDLPFRRLFESLDDLYDRWQSLSNAELNRSLAWQLSAPRFVVENSERLSLLVFRPLQVVSTKMCGRRILASSRRK